MPVANGNTHTQFNSATATAAATKRPRHRAKADITQIVEMQTVLWRMVTDPDVAPKDASACARAWSELRTRKRELLMIPAPGQLRPTSAKPQRKVKDRAEFTPVPAASDSHSDVKPPIAEQNSKVIPNSGTNQG